GCKEKQCPEKLAKWDLLKIYSYIIVMEHYAMIKMNCCPKDWKPFSSHCYFTVSDSASWSESEEKCSRMGAHLMVIHSQEEQDFITKILDAKAAYYIGLSDPGHRQWRWVDQTPYNESATFWHSSEPNDNKEQCVVVSHRDSGWGWNDILCSVTQKSVCQMKKIYL
uniref:C-type lectin domain-containing protein n=1 Tax=Peromyscus maniculatus bairdii TaxID=230844 RepID=A0A8C8U7Q1_PERMB